MRTIAAILLVLLIAAPAAAQHTIFTSLTTDPVVPAAGEPVTVTVAGLMSDGCWSVTEHVCGAIVEQELVISVATYDCFGRECLTCTLLLVPFEVTCDYVFPVAGTYTVRMDEEPDTARPIDHLPSWEEIEVEGATASEASSWSSMKSMYR
jgi:hypothetical protein